MGVKKFKFVSPGIFVDEIDNSQLPGVAPPIGPVVIGKFERGPQMRPTMVTSFSEFVDVFGLPIPGGKGGDVWRDGNYTAPTYAAYAAQAWLRNSSPITVVRLAGHEHSNADTAGTLAGWKTTKNITQYTDANTDDGGGAFGLFTCTSGSTVTTQATNADAIVCATAPATDDTLTINVPKAIGGTGETITIKFQDTIDTPTTKNTIHVHFTDNANAINNLNLLVNGSSVTADVRYSTHSTPGGDTTNGIAGLTSEIKSGVNTTLTLTAAAGTAGNNVAIELGTGNSGGTALGGSSSARLSGGADGTPGTLAAVFYLTEGSIALSGYAPQDGENVVTGSATMLASIAKNEYETIIYNSAGTEAQRSRFNFDETSDKYIRKVFNTNPILTNSTVTHADYQKNYWLGETFEREYKETVNQSGDYTGSWGVILGLGSGSAYHSDYNLGSAESKEAQTGWFISQDLTTDKANYQPYNMQKLFRLLSLNDAEWAQRNLKISIQEIKASTSNTYPYGTFSVVIRSISDNDKSVRIVERFSNCDLNPNSTNYIKRKIGDKYVLWDDNEARYREYGDFPNMSKYIRVETNQEVDAGSADARYLPFGVYGPPKFSGFSVVSGTAANAAIAKFPTKFNDAAVKDEDTFVILGGNANIGRAKGTTAAHFVWFGDPDGTKAVGADHGSQLTCSFNFPGPRLRISASHHNLSSPDAAYFGVDTTVNGNSSVRYENSLPDILRTMPKSINSYTATTGSGLTHSVGESAKTEYSWIFSLDDVGTGSASDAKSAFYRSGLRATGDSYSAVSGTYKQVLDQGFNRFTTCLHGGYDGLDITEKDPFRDSGTSGATAKSHYAFYSAKKAIDAVSDPEVVEMNLAVMPGIRNEDLTQHLINTCEERADALAIVDINGGYDPFTENNSAEQTRIDSAAVTTITNNVRTRGLDSSYGAIYWPWVQLRDTISSAALWAPPSVAALGALAYGEKSNELWFAPAGFNRGGLSQGAAGIPVIGVRQRLTSEERDKLYDSNINPIASFPAEGIVVFGQKTLQMTPSALDRINVRRLLIFLKKEVSRIAASILFEQNVEATWTKFTNQVTPFLSSVKARLGLADYKLVLDETTTTPDLVDRNIVYGKIFLKPVKAIEFIALDFVITDQGASFED